MLNHAMIAMPTDVAASLRATWTQNMKSEEWSAAIRKLADLAALRTLLEKTLRHLPEDLYLEVIAASGLSPAADTVTREDRRPNHRVMLMRSWDAAEQRCCFVDDAGQCPRVATWDVRNETDGALQVEAACAEHNGEVLRGEGARAAETATRDDLAEDVRRSEDHLAEVATPDSST